MRISRRRFYLLVVPSLLIAGALVLASSTHQEHTIIRIHGNERGGSYDWEGRSADSSDRSHLLYLRWPVNQPVVFVWTPGSGAHGVNLLPGSPATRWQDSKLHRNQTKVDWSYPHGGWAPTRLGAYTFYCPLHRKMWVRIIVNRSGKPEWS